MRHVVSRDEVAHLWANQRKQKDGGNDYARTSSDNYSFEGDELYSYTTQIGHLWREDGFVLLSERTYSITTAGHLREARDAWLGHGGIRVVDVPYVNPRSPDEHWANLAKLRRDCVEACKNLGNSRWYGTTPKELEKSIRIWIDYATAFKCRRWWSKAEKEIARLLDDPDGTGERLDDIPQSTNDDEHGMIVGIVAGVENPALRRIIILLGMASDDQREAEEENVSLLQTVADEFRQSWERNRTFDRQTTLADVNQKQFERESQWRHDSSDRGKWERLTVEERRQLWRERDSLANRMTGIYGGLGYYSGHALRWNAESKRIETSGGVKIGRREAVRLWGLLSACWEYRHDPIAFEKRVRFTLDAIADRPIDSAFHIDSIDRKTGFIKAGCHRIAWDEIALVAHAAGLTSYVRRWIQPRLTYTPDVKTDARTSSAVSTSV